MGKYLNMIRQVEKIHEQTGQDQIPIQGLSGPVEALPFVPGSLIMWQGADRQHRNGVVKFLHTDADGTMWAFCTCPDGRWTAVNTKYVSKKEDRHA